MKNMKIRIILCSNKKTYQQPSAICTRKDYRLCSLEEVEKCATEESNKQQEENIYTHLHSNK